MYIERVRIKNFRLLRNVELNFEEKTTVIVGRNNSGKTSLAELFRRLLTSDSPTFELEDFSLSVHERFWNAFQLHVSGEETETVREALPLIEISLHVNYAKNLENYGPLGEFIVDVNPSCTEALIIVQYRLKDGKIKNFFEDLGINPNSSIPSQKAAFFRDMKERIPKLFGALPVAVDPADSTNRKTVEWIKLRTLIQSGFVNAHREVDDTTHKDQNVLGKILQMLFETTMAESNGGKEHVVAKDLETAIQTIQQDIDENFNGQLSTFLPAMGAFRLPWAY
jgi:putative ATP-dependent endonuclease of OLD family